jgi:cell wall assembly regulator SMI1
MRDLWERLETVLKKQTATALDFLNPPASESEIQNAQDELGMRFPSDFTESLRIHNGQQEGGRQSSVCFIPQEYEKGGVYRATWGELAPLSSVIRSTEFIKRWSTDLEHNEFDGPVRRDGHGAWVVFVDSGSGDSLALDLKPAKGGQSGQVVSRLHDPAALLVLAPSFRVWFETLVSRFETGRYHFVEEDGEFEAVDRYGRTDNERVESEDLDEPDNMNETGDILRFPR